MGCRVMWFTERDELCGRMRPDGVDDSEPRMPIRSLEYR
jgi:hypothetical protein